VLTHSHLDHIAALPLMIDSVAATRNAPLRVHALPGTIEALRKHVFNDTIWPDFSQIPSAAAPFLSFHPVHIGQIFRIGGKTVEVLPALHTVPAVGYAIHAGKGNWVFSGDTAPHLPFWERVNQLNVDMLVIETAFSNKEHALAERSLHLSPAMLADALDNITQSKKFPIYVTHTKPAETDQIMEEVHRFDIVRPLKNEVSHDIRWLRAGQEFEI
jgi:ribonuclease BN (tRNA processing enzyme)